MVIGVVGLLVKHAHFVALCIVSAGDETRPQQQLSWEETLQRRQRYYVSVQCFRCVEFDIIIVSRRCCHQLAAFSAISELLSFLSLTSSVSHLVTSDGKYRDIFENRKNIENIRIFR